MTYPPTRKAANSRTYHGIEISDPYAWLEDDQSAETVEWVDAQNTVTFDYLNQLPSKAKLAKRFEALFNYEKVGQPMQVGDYYFLRKNSGLQNQSVIYYRKGISAPDQVFIDPKRLVRTGQDEHWFGSCLQG